VDIAAWLRDLGLERYEQAFREHEIDAEILPKLTSDDLREIGVAAIGHRRRLLEAIAALTDGPGRAPPVGQGAPIEAAVAARPAEAERRQLTVLFCDLVGSTDLSARLDPEDLREVMGAYQTCVAAVVRRWEGHVARYLGDGALAYFGWPRAHEDDAERAVRAGLELVDAVGQLQAGAEARLAARVGIATGQVVVGDLIGPDAADKDSVVGETPNLAARLQAVAQSGDVVISQATRRLVGGLFELHDLGLQRLKGFSEPLTVWRVAGVGRAEDRFEARQTAGLTALVGRDEEIALLLRRWQQVKDSEGQVVLLSGEPGIGKSRLVRELRGRLGGEPHICLLRQCSPHHQTSPLHPVIEQLERAAGFERDDPPATKLDKLEVLLAQGTEKLDEAMPLVAALLGVPTGDRYALPELTPQRQKQRTLEMLVDQLEVLAAGQPVLLVYEDAHWIDPTTQELLGLAIERIQHLAVLAIVTFRPEFVPPWSSQPQVSALVLTRLGRRDGAAMVDRVLGEKKLPAEVSAQIVAKTDGVPLFVEELTKTVLESGLLSDAGDRYELAGPLPPLAIPSTLHDSLLARLDRLAPAKEIAQIGAAIGREFSHALLAAVADRPETELHDALDQLVSSELVFRRGAPPDATYSFKHALVQDAAYGSLLRSSRQRLHAQIANALEERWPETAEAEPGLLAHHCTLAGRAENAVRYWYRAGRRAMARFAMKEAVAQFSQGLDALTGVPEGPERRRRELDLQVSLGGALITAKGYAAEETGRAFARARELSREKYDPHQLLPVLNGQVLFHSQRGEPHAAHGIAEEMLEQARRQGDPALLIPAHRALSLTLLHLGRFAAAREHAEAVLSLYDPARHRALASLYAFDQRVVALGYLASTLFALGYPDQGRQRSDEAVGEAEKLSHPNTVAQALYFACLFRVAARDAEDLRELAEALIAVARDHGLAHFLAVGRAMRGRVLVAQGTTEEGLAELEQGVAAIQASGTRVMSPYTSALLADARASAGQAREAVSRAAEVPAWKGGSSFWYEAEVHRLSGETLLSPPELNLPEAEACFRRSIEIAREQQAKLWELRAATNLARLWRDQGKRAEAHDLLAPVYGWFTEGFDTADLKDAKALLDEPS
jgi:class 3 adenylate cyclase/predicted ATPase